MADDDGRFTYNEISNADKELLLANGYKPGEMEPEDERDLLRDLRAESDDDDDPDSSRTDIPDERDGTE